VRFTSLALSVATVLAAPAFALPPNGSKIPRLEVDGVDGKSRALPEARHPVLVFYEDKDAGTQNQHARDVVGPITDLAENRDRLELMPIADLERWNFWPAKRYVFDHLKKISEKESTAVWCDWRGQVRRSLGLTKGKSGVLLIDTQGVLRFAGEGTLSAAQIEELLLRLGELGVVVRR
jgi:hypothetical protein